MPLPKLSVIVPSYNQGEYLEETILSIITQDYQNLELIVIDGGSADTSIDIIKKYEKYIYYWVSEKDGGQSDAINKGLRKATGEWVSWMNSDDCYKEGAFRYIFTEIDFDEYDFLYGGCYAGAESNSTELHIHHPKSKKELKDILKFFHHVSHIIPSQSVFIRKTIIDKVGLLKEQLHYCMDFDWFCRIYLATEKRLDYQKAICFFRYNATTKTAKHALLMKEEAIHVAERYIQFLADTDKVKIKRLIVYTKAMLKVMRSGSLHFFRILIIGIKFPMIAIADINYRTILKEKIKIN